MLREKNAPPLPGRDARNNIQRAVRSYAASKDYSFPLRDFREGHEKIGDTISGCLGSYVITKHLGSGGLSDIFVVKDGQGNQYIAKGLKLNFYFEELKLKHRPSECRSYILQEAFMLAHIESNGVIGIIDFGLNHKYEPFTILPILRGKRLDEAIDHFYKNGRMRTYPHAIPIAYGLCAIVSSLHGLGILHSDLKPTNVFIGKGGEPVLFDFGFARFMAGTTFIASPGPFGSPQYMAPEQFSNILSPSIDIYGIGAVLYDLLTGKPPFEPPTSRYRYLNPRRLPKMPRFVNPAIAPELEAVVMRALAVYPHERYQTVRELQSELAEFL